MPVLCDIPASRCSAGLLSCHHNPAQIMIETLVLRLVNRLRIAQHDQLVIGDTCMISRVGMRPRVGEESHTFIEAQTLVGNVGGQRIDFQNGFRRTLEDLA